MLTRCWGNCQTSWMVRITYPIATAFSSSGCTKFPRKDQFIPCTIRKNKMIEFCRREHGDFCYAKIGCKICGGRFVDELGMTHRILAILVDPRAETCVIVVANLFTLINIGAMIQFDSIGSSPNESIPWIQRMLKVQIGDKGAHLRVIAFESIPLTLRDRYHLVPMIGQQGPLLVNQCTHVIHGPVE